MLPALFVPSVREFAVIVIITWLADRLALAAFNQSDFYLVMGGFYSTLAVAVILGYKNVIAMVLAAAFLVTGVAAFCGFKGVIPFDIAASFHEVSLLVVMLTITGTPNGTITHFVRKGSGSINPDRRFAIHFLDKKE